MGAVREVPYVERAQAVADVYRGLTAGQNRKVLVVRLRMKRSGE